MSADAKKEAKKAARDAKRAEKLAQKAGARLPLRNKGAEMGNPKGTHPRPKKAKKKAGNKVKRTAAPVAMGYSLRNTSFAGRQVTSTGRCENAVTAMTTSNAGTFQVLFQWPINPGNSGLFPRAQALATIYEKWRVKFFEVEYLPLNASTTAGFFGMYIDVDATDASDTNVNSMLENKFNEGGSVWVPQTLRFAGPDLKRWYYTSGDTASSYDALARQNMPGILRVVADKCAANTTLGLIKIKYEFEFIDPKPPPGLMAMWYATLPTLPSFRQNSYTPVSGQAFYLPLYAPYSHAHGFNLGPSANVYSIAAPVANLGDTFALGAQADSAFLVNALAAVDYACLISSNGTTSVVFTPAGAAGTTATAQLALIRVTGDVVSEQWTGTISPGASAPVMQANTNASTYFTNISGCQFSWALKIVPGGTGIAAFTGVALSGALVFYATISRMSALTNYGATRASLPQRDASVSYTGQLPGNLEDAVSFLTDRDGQVSITVYPPVAPTEDELNAKALLKLRELLDGGELDTLSLSSIGSQRASVLGVTTLKETLQKAVPAPSRR